MQRIEKRSGAAGRSTRVKMERAVAIEIGEAMGGERLLCRRRFRFELLAVHAFVAKISAGAKAGTHELRGSG